MRPLRIITAVALTAALLVPVGTATAAPNRTFTRYDQVVTLARDGTASVTLHVDLDFSRSAGRGPIFTFITKMTLPDDSGSYRMIEYDDFEVSSPTGANTDVAKDTDSHTVTYRIGNEDQWYRDTQSYVVSFELRGVIEPNHAESGLDEFNWNAFGLSSDMSIEHPSVTVTGPTDLSGAACWSGTRYQDACSWTTDGATAVFNTDELDLYEGMQVVAGFPAGTFTNAAAKIRYYRTPGNVWRLTPLNIGGAGGVALLGILALVVLKRRRGSDQYFADLAPGMTPAPGEATRVVFGNIGTPAVQFHPPHRVRPAEADVLCLGTITDAALSATVVDLAVRGYFRVEQFRNADFRFTRTDRSPDGLLAYESELLDGLFNGSESVRKTDFVRSASSARAMQKANAELRQRALRAKGWFRSDPTRLSGGWFWAGLGLLSVGAVATFLVIPWGIALWGVALVGIGGATIVVGTKVSNRTALGSAVLAQVNGFREYLATAEADQLRWEEGEDIFSKYLPWAIVFGVAKRWSELFAQLEASGDYVPTTDWYESTSGIGVAALTSEIGGLTRSIESLVHSAESYASSGDSAAMSGSSGFSSGIDSGGGGGGFGGGGSSSW